MLDTARKNTIHAYSLSTCDVFTNMPTTKEVAELIKKDPTAVDSYMPLVLEAIRDDEEVAERYSDLRSAVEDHVFKEVKSK